MDKKGSNKQSAQKRVPPTRNVQSRYLQSTRKQQASSPNKTSFLRPAKSETCISGIKSSTPQKEQSLGFAGSVSSLDLSRISMSSDKPLGKKNTIWPKKEVNLLSQKHEEQAVQKELDQLYTEYLNIMYLKAIRKKEREAEKAEMEQSMMNMQMVLISRRMELHKWKQKVATLKTIIEIESQRKMIPDWKQILERVTAGNFEENMDRVKEHLEATFNQLPLRNIETPQIDGNQLRQILSETSEALRKLQEVYNSDEHKNKIKCLELEEKYKENLKWFEEKTSQLEKLSALSESMEIDSRKIDSIPNPFV